MRIIQWVTGLTLLCVFTQLCLFGYLTPSAYEISQLVHKNKDNVTRTINSVLHVSEQAEVMLTDINSFLEFRVMKLICLAPFVQSSTVGSYLCDEAANMVFGKRSSSETEPAGDLKESWLSPTQDTPEEELLAMLLELHASREQLIAIQAVLATTCDAASHIDDYLSDNGMKA